MNKKTVSIIIIAIVILVGIIMLVSKIQKVNAPVSQENATVEKPAEQQPETVVSTPTIKEAAPDQNPEGFPADLPLNKKTKTTQAFSATYTNSNAKQATMAFESSESIADNYAFYTKWAGDNSWEIINKADESALKFLYLRKDKEDINITITPIKDADGSQVSLSYVQF